MQDAIQDLWLIFGIEGADWVRLRPDAAYWQAYIGDHPDKILYACFRQPNSVRAYRPEWKGT